jgi:drug/metabolite transporter (DMT)-like permease
VILSSLAARTAPLRARWGSIPAPLRGAALMMISGAAFAGMNVLIRTLTSSLPIPEVVFFRNFVALVFMTPWIISCGGRGLRTSHHRIYLGRSTIAFVSMLLSFWGLALMPIAEATALGFTSPLFATIAAVIFLGEVVRIRRWTATIIGFIGALIIIRPGFAGAGFAGLQWPQLMIVLSSAMGGFNSVLVKQLTRTESSNAIVTYMTLYAVPMSLIPAVWTWVWPPAETWWLILLLGALGTLGHQLFTRAYAIADASAMAPLDFAKLPFAALIAWLAYGEVPDAMMWVGAAVIACSTAYIAHRETKLARHPRIATPVPIAAPIETAVATVRPPRAAAPQ